MSHQPSLGIEGAIPDIAILTSPAYTDARTVAEKERDGVSVEDCDLDEKRSLGGEDDKYGDEKDGKKTRVRVEPVDEDGVRWAGGDEILEAKGDDDDPAYADIPQIVRELCDFEDDVDTPIMTWRFYFLSAIFTALGAW